MRCTYALRACLLALPDAALPAPDRLHRLTTGGAAGLGLHGCADIQGPNKAPRAACVMAATHGWVMRLSTEMAKKFSTSSSLRPRI